MLQNQQQFLQRRQYVQETFFIRLLCSLPIPSPLSLSLVMTFRSYVFIQS